MGAVKFGKNEQKVAAEAPAQPAQEQSAPESQLPAKREFTLGDHIPSFDQIVLPRLNIVQNVGQLKDTFIPGSVVFGQQTVLFVPPDIDLQTGNVKRAATQPVQITVLGFRPTRYAEKIAGGARGLIVNSEEEVLRNGGTLDYKEWELKKASGMKRFEYLTDALVAIEKPASLEDDDTVFIYPVNGRKYAIAMWAMKGASYTKGAKVFFTARTLGALRKGYPTFGYNLSTRQETQQGTGNKYWVPVPVIGPKSSPEFLEFAAKVLGGDITPPNSPDGSSETE